MKEFKSGKKYVYSAEQANFYLQNRLIPIEIGTGNKGDIYFVYDYSEHCRLFPLWKATVDGWAVQNHS